MNETGRDEARGAGSASSWADETLPLGLRRELLDRELQQFIATKKGRAQSAAPARSAGENTPESARPSAGKRSSERAG
jgi:hypothetical protein